MTIRTIFLFFILIGVSRKVSAEWQITKQDFFDTAGNFDFNKYLSKVDFAELGRIKHHQKQIDSLGFNGRNLLYEAFTTQLFALDSNEYAVDSFAYLHKKIELGKTFKTIGEWDVYDPILYKVIGTYWLE